ncbi:MAG: TetR/AcrR family transcriptional regulator [Pseudomonadota bacterium]
MENRERKIIEAATQVFLRYGVKRASMGDIAAEAGVARQTLYNIYTNKDDILRGSIRLYGLDAMAAIEDGLPRAQDLDAQLALVFDEMAIKPYAFLHASPNAQDLIEGYNEAGRGEMEANYQEFQQVIARLLTPHQAALAKHGSAPEQIAEMIRRAAAGFKYQARDSAHLTALLRDLRMLVLAAAGVSAPETASTGPGPRLRTL